MPRLNQQRESSAALAIVIRMWIITLAILTVPALGAVIVGLNQCKDPACAGAPSARYVGR